MNLSTFPDMIDRCDGWISPSGNGIDPIPLKMFVLVGDEQLSPEPPV